MIRGRVEKENVKNIPVARGPMGGLLRLWRCVEIDSTKKLACSTLSSTK